MLGLSDVITACGLSISGRLADDVFEVRVHTGMRARSGAKEKPRRSEAKFRPSQQMGGKPIRINVSIHIVLINKFICIINHTYLPYSLIILDI